MASLWDKDGKSAARDRAAVGTDGGSHQRREVDADWHEHLDGRVAVYVANHLSYTDTPVIFGALAVSVSHRSASRPLQAAFYRVAFAPVWAGFGECDESACFDFKPGRCGKNSAGGDAVVHFSGGRPIGDRPSGEFMNGPAFMAIRAGVPIIPMALIGTYELLPMHSLEFHPVPVTLAVGDPIETKGYGMKQIDELTARVSEEICRLYYDHSYLEQPAKLELEAITVAWSGGWRKTNEDTANRDSRANVY